LLRPVEEQRQKLEDRYRTNDGVSFKFTQFGALASKDGYN